MHGVVTQGGLVVVVPIFRSLTAIVRLWNCLDRSTGENLQQVFSLNCI